MKTLFRTAVVLCSVLAGVIAFAPAAHAAPASIKPLYTTTVNGVRVRVYDVATLEMTPGVTKVDGQSAVANVSGPTPDVVFNEPGGEGYEITGHIYAAKFIQNGHVLCAYGEGDASAVGPTGASSLSLAVSITKAGATLNGWSGQVGNGIQYISGETLCVGAGDGIYTAFAYAIAYWPVPNLQLGGGGSASV